MTLGPKTEAGLSYYRQIKKRIDDLEPDERLWKEAEAVILAAALRGEEGTGENPHYEAHYRYEQLQTELLRVGLVTLTALLEEHGEEPKASEVPAVFQPDEPTWRDAACPDDSEPKANRIEKPVLSALAALSGKGPKTLL